MTHHIIIGGGIIGASAAYHLAREGEQVTIIDRGDKGQATDAAAGIISPWLSNRRNESWYRLAKEGARFYHELIPELEQNQNTDTGYRRNGTIALTSEDHIVNEKMNLAIQKQPDAPEIGEVKYLSERDVQRQFPLVANGYQGVFVSGGARVNGRLLRDSLIHGAVANGAVRIHGHAEVTPRGDHRFSVKVGHMDLFAENVIVTAGAWVNSLFKGKKLKMNIRPQKGQLIHLRLKGMNSDNWPVILPPKDYYVIPFEDGRMVIGATREDHKLFDTAATAGGIHAILDEVFTFAPGFKGAEFLETRVGTRPFSMDSIPVFGQIPELPGLYTANGLGASGLTTGPFIGCELAKLSIGKDPLFSKDEYSVKSLFL
ncbi:NAD(P)/FAD-dependent oxidoreductase [Salisediminibacterium beveridgei]|uniref:D-amino acid dehydrogenase small subunit n=1 Tax=Salisediminibacterium beveridgei TaxID=632773 RepID=A0A1D7QVC3_9BACI|nr:FAD-dependent oxidoreductase [Salisediminibacterium beveridgei]AOM82961.1 D-amino acid dehydrogenase small subunit [Salisediminibacterium beveridgei]